MSATKHSKAVGARCLQTLLLCRDMVALLDVLHDGVAAVCENTSQTLPTYSYVVL